MAAEMTEEMMELDSENRNMGEEDDDDSESEDSEKETDEAEKRIAELQTEIKENPYYYHSYIELLQLLQKTGELDQLRQAREQMSAVFPLAEELWLQWLRDEMKLATTEAEKTSVLQLFDRAILDYASVDIWLEYVQFSIGCMDGLVGMVKVRAVFERAVTAVGLNVAKGGIIWDAYREFENALYATLQPQPGAVPTAEQTEQLEQQKNRITTLFRRQLSCPLLDMEKTYSELQEWVDGNVDENINSLYNKALAKLEKLIPVEESLMTAEGNALEEYRNYINLEFSIGDPARIQCIYERALVKNCLLPDLWQEYTQYLERQLKIETVTLPVFERAVRNCPWSVALWQGYLRAMERYGHSSKKIKEVMDRAISSGFTTWNEYSDLWVTYLDYLRRRIHWDQEHEVELQLMRTTFTRAMEHMDQYFGTEADPQCTLLHHWARLEAIYCKNMEKARELWNDILNRGHRKSAQMWLEYANLERAYGDTKHCRKLFQRAMQQVTDWPEGIGNAWLMFEREEGTLASWEQCMDTFQARCKKLQESHKKEQVQQQEEQKKQEEREERRKERDKEKRKNKKANQSEVQNSQVQKRRKLEDTDETMDTEETAASAARDVGVFKEPFPPGSVPPPPGYKGPIGHKEPSHEMKDEVKEGFDHGTTVEHDPTKDAVTVFISNLNYSVDETKLREIMSKSGSVKNVRLVKDYKGRSKGYCYVEYSNAAEAQLALQRDREMIDNRPMFVSRCDPDKKYKGHQFRYSTVMEKNKLFVKGLPFSTTKEDLEEIFGAYGSVKDVRIVTYRNGHSKGLAFVDYVDAATAAAAILKTDGMQIEDKTISVAISNPPERKSRPTPSGFSIEAFHPRQVQSLGSGPKETSSRGKARTQVSFLPRSLQVSQQSSPSGSSEYRAPKHDAEEQNETDKKPKSNADFRKMLLGLK